MSDPKAVVLHIHQNVSLLCPCGNILAIMVRTGCATLQWSLYCTSLFADRELAFNRQKLNFFFFIGAQDEIT
jgi:hypothetical protein